MNMENTLIVHQKEIVAQGEVLTTKEYITKDYVFTKTGKKDIIYLKNKNSIYTVDHDNKSLKIIDITAQKEQMAQAKKMFPNTSIAFENIDTQNRKCTIEGRNTSAVLKSETVLKTIPALASTCYYDSYKFSQQAAIVPVETSNVEIVSEMNFTINFKGNVSSTIIKNSKVEIMENEALKEAYDSISNYKVEEEFLVEN